MITWLTHARVRLALHRLGDGGQACAKDSAKGSDGPPLMLLHPLGRASPATTPAAYESWPGPIYALDFTGHGASTIPEGGGYTAEILMADADTALAHLGPTTVAGHGLGAYIALLIAGARPSEVRGAILCDGPGLAGGAPGPTSGVVRTPDPGRTSPPDPFALSELATDIRPPDYATAYVRQALQLSGMECPITVCAKGAPEWIAAVVNEPGVRTMTVTRAVADYARFVSDR